MSTSGEQSESSDARGSDDGASDAERAAAVAFAVTEYSYLTTAILLYRRLETFLLGGTGVVLTGAVGAVAAIEAAKPGGERSIEATVLAAAAWGPTLMLLAEMTALARIQRVSTYLARQLQPFACRLAGTEVLGWEPAPSARLVLALQEARPRTIWTLRLAGSQFTVSRREVATGFFLSSAPFIIVHSSVTIAFSVFASVLHPVALVIAPCAAGVIVHLCLGRFAYVASMSHESRQLQPTADAETPSAT